MSVRAVLVDDVAEDERPGVIDLRTVDKGGRVAGMGFRCPCGCGREGWLPFEDRPGAAPSWSWDGDVAAPTLTPSVQQVGGCLWHGWLRNGEWVTA